MNPSTHDDVDRFTPTRRAIRLLPRLTQYQAMLHGPCERCGSQLWAHVRGGYRCLVCCPPLAFPESARRALKEILP
jgi:hypothetical protein